MAENKEPTTAERDLLVQRLEVISQIYEAERMRSDAKMRLAKIHAQLTKAGLFDGMRSDW
ncbi:hypothetical protein [Cognatazoarcus halotolerans]|uniref:hypothetical protein n=1 Tax=Cognatazoarcus halotolerans TaxID=2686016 RepID=UPI001356A391|nr:hypothetical protein [Cognatazoarcus halotolerans]MCP5233481.1 hypothetical protein [Zoogloeaceae bacterium]